MTNKSHPLYICWKHMRRRCSNPSDQDYKNYGGRGIVVYPPWDESKTGRGSGAGFRLFAQWIEENLGPRPEGTTLDRIEVDGNYEPGNLRWASHSEQASNRRLWTKKDKRNKYACIRKNGRWGGFFRHRGKQYYAGEFDTPEEASQAARIMKDGLD